mmetsp:Transcript_1866/g.4109  ORF Transcript_1866/g.4109 Transcript_1866/m.4109 type:complete len:96 (+) Transcript_1866:407-694(+)
MAVPSQPVASKGNQGRNDQDHNGKGDPPGTGVNLKILPIEALHLATNEYRPGEGEDYPEQHNEQDSPRSVTTAVHGFREARVVVLDIRQRLARTG